MPSENVASKARRRITQSRLAKPLLTSLGSVTILAASSFVLLAVSSTGSMKPWDWGRADPAAAIGRYQYCGHLGLGTIGCMLGAGFRPASAAPAAADQRPAQPLVSVATIQDPAPAVAAGSGQAARPSGGGPSRTSGGAAAAPHHLVQVQPGESTDAILAACQAAMRTAQGTSAAAEVVDECEAALQPRCPAVRMPQAQGAAAVEELALACQAPASPVPSPSGSPGHEGGDD